ncbi:hypothetical protein CMQ_691 [Grosmannia clavigera kw1407]|uniref:Uncharacterized protein n=1 Tax=Grosmannia clavigera (strain kw1407 / UAMH 11150) TaxID=655863 RepID=F0XER1_GROCL|nr:uncharacterized protein CMQ_691 [Grosmannia clavigera kw1407]EFX03763.1 hypothetical protein CMQ_691 [Grosmannia clavigera kw1407]
MTTASIRRQRQPSLAPLVFLASVVSLVLAELPGRNDAILQLGDAGAANLLPPPAIPLHADFPGLSPAYGFEPAKALLRRDGGGCASNFHSCEVPDLTCCCSANHLLARLLALGLDINSSLCCQNSKYCFIDPTSLGPACCDIGSVCGSSCSASQYECNATTTITLRAPTTGSSSGSSATAIALATSTTISVYSACCARRCPQTSMFACASSLGNGCCSYGQTCASSSQCMWTTSTSSSTGGSSKSTKSISLTSATSTSSCGTSQITCPTALGIGCCALGYACTVVTSQLFCAQETAIAVTKSNSSGLSSGVKVGIAVGVIIGAAAIIGGGTWVCLRQRHRQSSAGSRSENPRDFDPYQMANSDGQPGGGGAFFLGGNPHSQTQSSAMADSPVRSWRRPLHLRRNTTSGSNNSAPESGPPGVPTGAMDREGDLVPLYGPGGLEMFPPRVDAAHGADHGVPVTPQAPYDIVAPVEIDSTAVMRPERIGGSAAAAGPPFHAVSEQFELDGSEVPPASSYTHTRAPSQQQALGASSSSDAAAAQTDESPIVPRYIPSGLLDSLS